MQNDYQVVLPEPTNLEADTRLGEFARQLAQTHAVGNAPKQPTDLLDYLQSWEQALRKANAIIKAGKSFDPGSLLEKDLSIAQVAFKSGQASRAGEWMLDNYYLVKQTFHQIEEDLPARFLKQLPKLVGTSLIGHSRIFALAWEWLGYNQSQIDLTQAAAFVRYYQEVAPLTIGELWALPIMLRVGILEQLVRAAIEVTGMDAPPRPGRNMPDPDDVNLETMSEAKSLSEIPSGLAASLVSTETIIANCFLSLRLLASTDWKVFFEQTSRVENILRNDPAGIYARMDFDTRNSYRTVVEELACQSPFSEEAVASTVIEFAQREHRSGVHREAHIGYFLRDAGRAELERKLFYQRNLKTRLINKLLASPTRTYLGSIAIFSILFLLAMLAYAWFSGAEGGSPVRIIVVGMLGFGLALEAAITLVHWNVSHRIKPQSLPRMDFSEGIPTGNRTMVVVPTLLESAGELNHLVGELELYYLSNRDPLLTYALLTDFGDAPSESMPQDEELLALAGAGIKRLNQKYADEQPFYLFHRTRQWNQSEGVWMGWERKRGKLADFNRLLLTAGAEASENLRETFYATQVGQASILSEIKYVITLDADTSLPQGSANRLVATLAHPLNHAEFAPDGRSVVAGYTVLQPRVAIKPTSANRSLFAQIFAGNTGFDLYSFAVSDVYQDLFGEGSYVGKGIYDVAAFEHSLAGQVRQNTLLSHDLFEGIYGRAALVTDIVLYEEYPSRYLVYARRLRRWIRGDWQLLPWLFPVVLTQSGWSRNRLSTINLWKIFDNLRRSLLPPTQLALLAASWVFLPGSALVWTLLVLLPSALPIAMQTTRQVQHNHGRLSFSQLLKPAQLPLIRWTLAVLFLPYEALLMLGAIRTTLARLLISRKNLLQWTTAANASRSQALNPYYELWREMAVSSILSVLLGVAITIFNPVALWVALPLLLGWLVTPHIAFILSKPVTHVTQPLTESERRHVQRLARRTWAFFERFAGPDDHWLPPDHFQDAPRGSVAHYTTPTNIGVFLISTLAAYDLGYLGLSELAVRLHSTFENLAKLEHYRGHLLNWYDSQSLTALPPRYISTVDSGNLAACLITLKQGCQGLADAPLLSEKQWQGLLALLDILAEALQSLEKNNPHALLESFSVELSSIYERVSATRNRPADWRKTLDWLSNEGFARVSQRLMELLENHPNLNRESLGELQLYLDLMHHHLQDMQRSMDLFMPWLGRLNSSNSPGWQDFFESLSVIDHLNLLQEPPTLGAAPAHYERTLAVLKSFRSQQPENASRAWCLQLEADINCAHQAVTVLLADFRNLADQADQAVGAMDFRFLFDERRQIFHIGYNASTERLDASYYDLLASEARVASLIAIAKGDVPPSHWQHLGRPVTSVNGKQVLLSWSGTMFEYLMPGLFTRNYPGTFISDSCYAVLDAQISYGREKQIPWGISESGYYAFDADQNYQYRAFGVPDLGYKRDLPDDLVMTPYASLLGLSLQPQAVVKNMEQLEKLNMLGRFGFYEALDYTEKRLPAGEPHAIVQSYMAHHQGMILLAVCNYLSDDLMVRRFHADEHIKSVELLLQEKIPQNPPLEYPHSDEPVGLPQLEHSINSAPWRVQADSPIPQVQILSQGETSLMITSAGGGYSQWCEFALTRWQADTTLDQWGTWIYMQDRESGALWSATCQPFGCTHQDSGNTNQRREQEVLFYPHKVEFQRWDNDISMRTGVTISTDGVEIRRVNIQNDSNRPRRLTLTSYGEVILAAQATDRRHPAFNKLFIESEYLPRENALIFQRRPRAANEKSVVLVHGLIIESGRKVTGEWQSNRAEFLGRLQTTRTPLALGKNRRAVTGAGRNTVPINNFRRSLLRAGSVEASLADAGDPIFSLTQEIELKAHAKTRVTFLTLTAPTRAEALEKLTRYQTGQSIHRAFDDARAKSERALVEQGINVYNVANIQRIYSALLYTVGTLRSEPHILAQNTKGPSGLWGFGISGDFPLLLVRIRNGESSLLLETLQAFTYWRSHHAKTNLLILNDQDTGYALDLHNAILRQIRRMGLEGVLNQREGIFVLRTDQLQPADQILFQTVAGVILDEKNGSLAEQALHLTSGPTRLPQFTPSLTPARDSEPTSPLGPAGDLLMDNTFGGFSRDGREYVITLRSGQHTPHPWINVIANPDFGFLVSESGLGSTWAENSGENRLTPWNNDPVTDMPGEALYLRDEETGLVWSPTPMPAGAETTHIIHHGAGYSLFESQSHGLNQKLRLFAAPAAPLKVIQLHLQNLWDRPRRITVTYYAEWVLGTTHETQQAYINPEFDSTRHALLANNPYNSEFGERVAFLAANKKPHGVTSDRTEFLGRLGSLRAPAALGRIGLASAVNAGLDPCAAIQMHVDLAPGETEVVYFLLGQGANRAESLALITETQAPGQVETLWQSVGQQWDDILGSISVDTPDPAMNLMLNRWLLYQTLSCRLWGRTALYQSSGAFGFRDQLQDVLALLHTRPGLARAQIIEAARHQFEAGDVLHWWNPPSGRGIRTRFSDDLLWLPYVTAEYVRTTGDASILAEKLPFLKGEALKPDEMERYALYESAVDTYSLYQHCRRAIEKGTTFGVHGLPLMGAGDWNDGMNRVGIGGRGESIWLGWFLTATLTRFAGLADLMLEDPALYLQQAEQIAKALEANAWDGDWYLRAFYDDGEKLGSRENDECRIDSIAQSWAVLSGSANPARATRAMESVYHLLVKQTEQMILLFTPPFNKSQHDPGYIKGYLPGKRENGGQYSHAATWVAWAFARLGQGERAAALFSYLNPISHSNSREKAALYQVEPYVIAADIYSALPQPGRGGWTWYTGSSGWMYRLGIEAILGITRQGDALIIDPCIPRSWPGFKLDYRFGNTHYKILVENSSNVNRGIHQLVLDGKETPSRMIPLADDGELHQVRVVLG